MNVILAESIVEWIWPKADPMNVFWAFLFFAFVGVVLIITNVIAKRKKAEDQAYANLLVHMQGKSFGNQDRALLETYFTALSHSQKIDPNLLKEGKAQENQLLFFLNSLPSQSNHEHELVFFHKIFADSHTSEALNSIDGIHSGEIAIQREQHKDSLVRIGKKFLNEY